MNAAMTGDEFIGRGHELVRWLRRVRGGRRRNFGVFRKTPSGFFGMPGFFAPSSPRVSVASSCSQRQLL